MAEFGDLKDSPEGQPFFQSVLDSSLLEFDRTLDSDVARQLIHLNVKVSVAETLTRGLLSVRLARVAEQFFDSGVICTTPQAAIRLCGVQPSTLRQHGFASIQTAQELAMGFQKRTQTNLCIALTGNWTKSPQGNEGHRGVVNMAFLLGQREKIKTFPLQGHASTFPEHAVQSVLVTLKNWLQFLS
jgi:nicotinamide-nucleotide amidase